VEAFERGGNQPDPKELEAREDRLYQQIGKLQVGSSGSEKNRRRWAWSERETHTD
jgi:hypothetical protein